jgi:hypothetical protein
VDGLAQGGLAAGDVFDDFERDGAHLRVSSWRILCG